MKRSHRTMHRLVWLLLAPALAAIIVIALQARPGEPVNDALPAELLLEAN